MFQNLCINYIYLAISQIRYVENNYFAVDPVVQHGSRSTFPLVWSSNLLGSAPDFGKMPENLA